jgi:hypothetical protein
MKKAAALLYLITLYYYIFQLGLEKKEKDSSW